MSLLEIGKRALGLFLILVGFFLVFFFPGSEEHQLGFGTAQVSFDVSGIAIGVVLIIAGGFLLFY